MNRANQQQLVQEANMTLIDIRFYELQYFGNFFSIFGVQAVLMAGFMITSLSQQNPGVNSDSDAPYGSIVFYWMTSAICLAFGFYTICGAIVIQIYGENLAINGPIGSMITALEGMITEQRHVVISFLWTTFFFLLQYAGMCWYRMDQISAISVSAVIAAGILFAYRMLLRVYNRFSYHMTELKWSDKDERRDAIDVGDMRPSVVEDIGGWVTGNFLPDPTSTEVITPPKSFKEFARAYGKEGIEGLGGHLTVMTKNRMGQNLWKRRYLVLKDRYLFFYKSKQIFQSDPNKHLNTRPLNLEGYTMVAGSMQAPFLITVVPVETDDGRKIWRFRCDTSAEYNRWIEVLMVVISVSNEHDVKDFVTIYPDDNKTVLDDTDTVFTPQPGRGYVPPDFSDPAPDASRDSRSSWGMRSSQGGARISMARFGGTKPLHTIQDDDEEDEDQI